MNGKPTLNLWAATHERQWVQRVRDWREDYWQRHLGDPATYPLEASSQHFDNDFDAWLASDSTRP